MALMEHDITNFHYNEKHKESFNKAIQLRKFPCPICHLWGCICQITLDEFIEKPKPMMQKDVCKKCERYLCDCPRNAVGEVL